MEHLANRALTPGLLYRLAFTILNTIASNTQVWWCSSISSNPKAFTVPQPILKTTDAFGTNLGLTASTSGIEFGYDNSDNSFDSSSTTLTKDTTGYTFNTWSGSQLASGLGGYGGNSAQVWKATDGNVKRWNFSTIRPIATSGLLTMALTGHKEVITTSLQHIRNL